MISSLATIVLARAMATLHSSEVVFGSLGVL